jgi:hypothetical protein
LKERVCGSKEGKGTGETGTGRMRWRGAKRGGREWGADVFDNFLARTEAEVGIVVARPHAVGGEEQELVVLLHCHLLHFRLRRHAVVLVVLGRVAAACIVICQRPSIHLAQSLHRHSADGTFRKHLPVA